MAKPADELSNEELIDACDTSIHFLAWDVDEYVRIYLEFEDKGDSNMKPICTQKMHTKHTDTTYNMCRTYWDTPGNPKGLNGNHPQDNTML